MKDLLIINLLLFVLAVLSFHPAAFACFGLSLLALAGVGAYNFWLFLSHRSDAL